MITTVDFTEQSDEVDTEKRIIVLDVDGVNLTFELAAIKTVLPAEKKQLHLEAAQSKIRRGSPTPAFS